MEQWEREGLGGLDFFLYGDPNLLVLPLLFLHWLPLSALAQILGRDKSPVLLHLLRVVHQAGCSPACAAVAVSALASVRYIAQILVLDEATANVDVETDALIQVGQQHLGSSTGSTRHSASRTCSEHSACMRVQQLQGTSASVTRQISRCHPARQPVSPARSAGVTQYISQCHSAL